MSELCCLVGAAPAITPVGCYARCTTLISPEHLSNSRSPVSPTLTRRCPPNAPNASVSSAHLTRPDLHLRPTLTPWYCVSPSHVCALPIPNHIASAVPTSTPKPAPHTHPMILREPVPHVYHQPLAPKEAPVHQRHTRLCWLSLLEADSDHTLRVLLEHTHLHKGEPGCVCLVDKHKMNHLFCWLGVLVLLLQGWENSAPGCRFRLWCCERWSLLLDTAAKWCTSASQPT
jgi:hypothetical protein